MLTFGLIINPVAGIGGSVALKGSDGAAVQNQARARGGAPRGCERTQRVLESLGPLAKKVRWLTWGGAMGAEVLDALGIEHRVLGEPAAVTSAADTEQGARALAEAGVDLLVFCGGDGTARDIWQAVHQSVPVLGIPGGVKMHSGVFATTPESAARILEALLAGGLVRAALGEVRDLDEEALRQGMVRPRYFGELAVPEAGGFLQHTKESGRESEPLALQEIVAEVVERLDRYPDLVILGPGGSLAAIKQALGIEPTLIGFDVMQNGKQVGWDVDGDWLEDRLSKPAARGSAAAKGPLLILSFTRNQGFLIGRGNQQLTPAVLQLVPRQNLWVVGTRSKLLSLEGRPLLIDTDDAALDRAWSGLVQIITGYDDRLWYRLSSHA